MPGSGAEEPSKVLAIGFELDGQKFTALNGGPVHTFSEGMSLVFRCDSREEIDYYWSKLIAGQGDRLRPVEGSVRRDVAGYPGVFPIECASKGDGSDELR